MLAKIHGDLGSDLDIHIFPFLLCTPYFPYPKEKIKRRKKQKGHPFVYANVLSGSMSFPCTHC